MMAAVPTRDLMPACILLSLLWLVRVVGKVDVRVCDESV